MTAPVFAWGGSVVHSGGVVTSGTSTGTYNYSYTVTGATLTYATANYAMTSNGWVELGYLDSTLPAGEQGPARALSDDEIEARRVTARGAAEREAAAFAAREAAQAKARALLLSLLPDDQKEFYQANRMFEIVGSHGTRYRIRHGIAGNIDWLDDDDRVGGSLCCHASVGWGESWMPTEDVMIGQMLALRADELEFLRVANGRKPPVLRRAA